MTQVIQAEKRIHSFLAVYTCVLTALHHAHIQQLGSPARFASCGKYPSPAVANVPYNCMMSQPAATNLPDASGRIKLIHLGPSAQGFRMLKLLE
jgi:hypothetical protein